MFRASYFTLILLIFAQAACIPALEDPNDYVEVPDFGFLRLEAFEIDVHRIDENSKVSSHNALSAAYKVKVVQELLRNYTEDPVSLFSSAVTGRLFLEEQEILGHMYQEEGAIYQLKVLVTRAGELVEWTMTTCTPGSAEAPVMEGLSTVQGEILEWYFYGNGENQRPARVKKVGKLWKLTLGDPGNSGRTASVEIRETGGSNWLGFNRHFQSFEITMAENQRGELVQREIRKCWDQNLNNTICR